MPVDGGATIEHGRIAKLLIRAYARVEQVAQRYGANVAVEPIRRLAVRVDPRARFGNGARQTQATRESRLRVLVLVERLLPSAVKARKRPQRHERTTKAAAPFAREVPRLDLLEGPFLRGPAFFVATAGSSVSRERH